MKFLDFVNFIFVVLKTTEQEDLKFFKLFSESEIRSIVYSKKVMDCFLFVFKTGQILIKGNLEADKIEVKSSFEKADSDRKDMKLIEFAELVYSLLVKSQKEDLAFFNALSESEIRLIVYSEERRDFVFSFVKGKMVIKVDHESRGINKVILELD